MFKCWSYFSFLYFLCPSFLASAIINIIIVILMFVPILSEFFFLTFFLCLISACYRCLLFCLCPWPLRFPPPPMLPSLPLYADGFHIHVVSLTSHRPCVRLLGIVPTQISFRGFKLNRTEFIISFSFKPILFSFFPICIGCSTIHSFPQAIRVI